MPGRWNVSQAFPPRRKISIQRVSLPRLSAQPLLPGANAIANRGTDRYAGRTADRAARVDADRDSGAHQHDDAFGHDYADRDAGSAAGT